MAADLAGASLGGGVAGDSGDAGDGAGAGAAARGCREAVLAGERAATTAEVATRRRLTAGAPPPRPGGIDASAYDKTSTCASEGSARDTWRACHSGQGCE